MDLSNVSRRNRPKYTRFTNRVAQNLGKPGLIVLAYTIERNARIITRRRSETTETSKITNSVNTSPTGALVRIHDEDGQ